MILRIDHKSSLAYEAPQRNGTFLLRMTPRDHEGQHVRFWRIETEPGAKLRECEDHFGNRCHVMDLPGPFERLTIEIEGEVSAIDMAGIVRGAPDPFPPLFFLRETSLTRVDDALARYARELAAATDELSWLHQLMGVLPKDLPAETEDIAGPRAAAEAFASKRATSQDYAHLFVALARHRRIPARYVSGYVAAQGAALGKGHAWAEAFLPNLGWVGFDPSTDQSPIDSYIRIAIGLDGMDAAPIRGPRTGGETPPDVRLGASGASAQSQS